MGAQSIHMITLESKRQEFEDLMIEGSSDLLLYKHYRLGNEPNIQRNLHIHGLYKAYSSSDCNVRNFLKKHFELDHKYLDIENSRICEEFNICYNNKL